MKPAELEAIYSSLPKLVCKGLCSQSCGPIAVGKEEAKAMRKALPTSLDPVGDDLTCKALLCGQCQIYAQRPLICRLWGAVEEMRCPWGCVPDLWLSKEEQRKLMDAVYKNGVVTTLPA